MARALERRTSLFLVVGVAQAAIVFALRLLEPGPEGGVTFLYVLPVLVIAVAYGPLGGLAAGAVALALFGLGNELSDTHIEVGGYISRGAILLTIGVIAGEGAKRLRSALMETEAAAKHFEVARDMLGTVGREGTLLDINGSWEATLGWTSDELLGRPLLEFMHPEDRERLRALDAWIWSDHDPSRHTIRMRTADGAWRWLEWSARLDPGEETLYCAVRDVTDRVAAERALRAAEERFRGIFENSPNGMALIGIRPGARDEIVEANECLSEMLGVDNDELIGMDSLASFTHHGDVERVKAAFERLWESPGEVYRDDIRIVRADGEELWVRLTSSVIVSGDGEPVYRLSQLADIDARKRAENELEREREFKSALLESLNAAVLAVQVDGEVTFMNRAARELRFGHGSLGEWRRERTRRPDGSTLPAPETPIARALDGEVVRGQEVGLRADDGMRILLVNGRPIVGPNGETFGAVVAGDDITERKQAEEQLRHLADHDALSGLLNRRRFEIELQRELAHSHGHGRAVVLVLDVDGFKRINDTLGHAVGDRVIARIGDALNERLRTADVVARIGGDEFAVILRRTDLEQAEAVADSLRELIAAALDPIVGELAPARISIGLASIDGDESLSADQALKRADAAMYSAKKAGGDRLGRG